MKCIVGIALGGVLGSHVLGLVVSLFSMNSIKQGPATPFKRCIIHFVFCKTKYKIWHKYREFLMCVVNCSKV